MGHRFLSVCMFCLICATHSPCGSHAAVNHESPHIKGVSSSGNHYKEEPAIENSDPPLRVKLKTTSDPNDMKIVQHSLRRRSSISNEKDETAQKEIYLKKIFDKFGDGQTLTVEGFHKFMEKLDLLQILSRKLDNDDHVDVEEIHNVNNGHSISCPEDKNVFVQLGLSNITETSVKTVNSSTLERACPTILYSLMTDNCNMERHSAGENDQTEQSLSSVWVYSCGAVILTSACGLLALIIIPVMQKKFYKPLLQFLVALAVGTLAGDAFLHLLPHAMTKPHSHGSEKHLDDGGMDDHDENMWKGFVAMMGLTFFFVMERLILLAGKWRKGRHKKPEAHSHMKFFSNGLEDLSDANPTQCMDRYNPYPYCYQDILNHQIHGCPLESDKTASTMLDDDASSDISMRKSKASPVDKREECNNHTENNLSCAEANKMLPDKSQKNDITIILREHGSSHHGHSHSHGHVHAAPQNFSSVAWMVIMGDGLHNFTDGMAIGAAFSNSLAGGFSTAVAVFCHELPHELGDFAMLLKAGMTIKQAIYYNLLSSVLSFLGNIAGVCLGNTETASSWMFAMAAGMFIYIALVDMMPELSSSHEDESNIKQCLLHLCGLLLGVGIMTMIAMYERDLKSIFKETS